MIRRFIYIAIGIGFFVLGVLRDSFPLWRRVVVIAGGLFFIYVGLMYYLPKYRRKREELNRTLDEAEREMDENERK